ncbi:MAG: YncE family protein [Candidatus Binatia bacterium]
MLHRTTGEERGPATPRLLSGRAAVVCAAALLFAAAVWLPVAAAEPLVCGVPLARQLKSGATDSFQFSLSPGTALSLEAVDTSRTIDLLKISFSPSQETCLGDLEIRSPGEMASVEVSDCVGQDAGDYTIALSVVSPGPDNCGVPLPCGSTLQGERLDTLGEVDSYTFPGIEADRVRLTATDVAGTIGCVRLRVFDPGGSLVEDLFNQPFDEQLTRTGTYTALVSACVEPRTGPYTITWQPSSCPGEAAQGQLAYVANSDAGTVSLIDLTALATRAVIPLVPPAQAMVAAPVGLDISPNGGFAYATYGTSSTAVLINTTTNLIAASVPVGLDAAGVAFTPDGASTYVISNDLGGISVIDNKTNRVTGIIAPDVGFSETIQFATDGATAFVVSDDLGGLAGIDTATNEITSFSDLDLGFFDAFAISPDGAFAYAGVLDGIAVIETATNTIFDMITLDDEPFGIAFSPSGGRAYASLPDESKLAVIDTESSREITRIPVGVDTGGVAVSGDGALVYVTDFTSAATDVGFWVIDAATNRVVGGIPTMGDGPASVVLTTAPEGLCVGDAEGETKVTVDELVRGVNQVLNGCPGRFPRMSVLAP